MGAVLSLGIGLILGLVFTVIGLFFGNIILFDSLALAVVAGVLANKLLHIHPALCLLIGIGLFLGLYFLQNTSVGFWVIGSLLSVFWGFVFAFIAYEASGQDMVWFWVVFGLGVILMLGLHKRARIKM